ncbi:hypothetical protein [Paracoccus mutanolyticus]|uniref:hypothetical protein n=1 Tax=Paracoccus mutanolyticus TaxID=1499308 RepID=UPI001672A259|nr:hypothetical protein [Paracoccus mutanolyticus]
MLVVTHEMGFARPCRRPGWPSWTRANRRGGPPERIFHAPRDERIQGFLRTYHERNSF